MTSQRAAALLAVVLFPLAILALPHRAAGQQPRLTIVSDQLARLLRIEGVEEVAALGPRSAPHVRSLVRYHLSGQRTNEHKLIVVRAIRSLAAGGAPAVGTLCRLLGREQESMELRSLVALTLGDIGGRRAITCLVSGVGRADAPRTRAAILRGLGAARSNDARVVEVVAEALEHEDRDVRVAALEATSQIARTTAAGRERLSSLVADEDANVRIPALRALAVTAPEEESTRSALERASRDRRPHVRLAAVEALPHVGADALPHLVSATRDGSRAVRVAAVRGLVAVAPSADSVSPLIDRLSEADVQVEEEIIAALEDLQVVDRQEVRNAISGAFDRAPQRAFDALTRGHPEAAEPLLRRGLDSSEPDLRVWALRQLRTHVAEDGGDSAWIMTHLAGPADARERMAAVRALSAPARRRREAVAARLCRLVEDPVQPDDVREMTLRLVFPDLTRDHPGVLDSVRVVIEADSPSSVERSALGVLSRAGPLAFPILRRLIAHPDPRVRASALDGFPTATPPPDLLTFVVGMLARPDRMARAIAILGACDPSGTGVVDAVARGLDVNDSWVVASVANILGRWGRAASGALPALNAANRRTYGSERAIRDAIRRIEEDRRGDP